MDLPALKAGGRYRLQTGATTATGRRAMDGDLIRFVAEAEGGSGMTWLAPGLVATLLAQAFGLFLESVTGRWLAAIVAVFMEALFQFFDPCRKSSHYLLQVLDQSKARFGSSVIERLELFTGHSSGSIYPKCKG
jgi:hypothetical protein